MFVFVMLSCLFLACWERADLLARLCFLFSCVFSLSYMFLVPHQNKGRGWYRYTCLSSPVIFTDHSKAVLLLWIIFVVNVSRLYLLCCLILSVPCDHLLGNGWTLEFYVSLCILTFPYGVVLGCIGV